MNFPRFLERSPSAFWLRSAFWLSGALFALPVSAQHSDVFVYQQNGALVPTDASAPQQAFSRLFDFFGHPFGNTSFPKAFIAENPGFQTNASPPAGMTTLPIGATLSGDFLPFQIPGNVSGNVLHWDPSAGAVNFQTLVAGHFLEIEDAASNSDFTLDGSSTVVGDVLLGIVNPSSGIHEHISWRLDDGDGNAATDPAAGVYLMMLQAKMAGVGDSDPFAILLNSTDVSVAEQTAATSWVTNQIGAFTVLGDSLTGDFDGNSIFDSVDVDQLVAAVASSSSDGAFDVNGDGAIDYGDVSSWLAIAGAANLPSMSPYLVGDANLDGFVDVSDFHLWSSNNSLSAVWSRGDFNADGIANNLDFSLWNGNKFRGSGVVQAVVPEPDFVVLIGWLSWAGLWLRKRRADQKELKI